jgi:predicted enzyme related to lactoylglutathione lyase
MNDGGSNGTKPKQRIEYAELPSRDLKATKRFYSTAFGWEFKDF